MIRELKMGAYVYNDEALNFEFYTNLKASEKLKFVNSVVDLLVSDSQYHSIIRDLVFDYITIKIFTTIDLSMFEESDSFLNDVEYFLEETDVVKIVKENVFPTLFDELNEAVDNSIKYLTGINENPLNKSLANLFNTLERKVNEIDSDEVVEIASKLSNITGDFTIDNIVKAYMDSNINKDNLQKTE